MLRTAGRRDDGHTWDINTNTLIEVFSQNGFCTHDLADLNICRMYLHAVTLSDL
jgi:hypothetical protein